MTQIPTKHQRLAALRPLSPESVASLAAAWDVRMVASFDHFIDISKMIAKPTSLRPAFFYQVGDLRLLGLWKKAAPNCFEEMSKKLCN